MPTITPYISDTSPQGEPQSRRMTLSDTGGMGMVNFGNEIMRTADVLHEREVRDDTTDVRVRMAQTRAKWDVEFKNQSLQADPGDNEWSDRFVQAFTDDLSKQGDNIKTREGSNAYKLLGAELTQHFAEKAGLFQTQLAGAKATQDWDVSQRAYATSVSTDPTSYSGVLKQALSELRDPNGQYGRIDTKTRGALEIKARDTLAQSYIFGLVDAGAPELARQILMEGKLDDQLEPKDKQRLIHMADQGITAKRVAAEHADALERKAEKDRVAAINDDLMGKFTKSQLTMADVRAAGIPAFGEGSQHTWITMLKQQAKDILDKPARTNPAVFNDMRARIDAAPGDPRKLTDRDEIWKLYGNGLSEADAARLERRYQDARSEEGQKLSAVQDNFLKGVRPQLDRSNINPMDSTGPQRFANFTSYVQDRVDAARKTPGEDPRELFRAGSPKYLGKDVPQFQTGAQHLQSDIAGRVGASMEKNVRRPGETPAQFLERTRK